MLSTGLRLCCDHLSVASVSVHNCTCHPIPQEIVITFSDLPVMLWQSLKGYLQELKKPQAAGSRPGHKAATRDMQALLLPLELRLSLRGATVKFEHHPMEVSPCSHGCQKPSI